MDDTLVIVLAGGAGERLYPLTKDRAKPAVYFGGPYRIIDFTLSNCINSGLRRIFIVTQYKSLSLNRHIRHGLERGRPRNSASSSRSCRRRSGSSENWYLGTADAVFQNLYSDRPRVARATSSSWPATTSTRWTTRKMLTAPPGVGRGRHPGRHRGARRARPRGSAWSRSTTIDRVVGFQEKPQRADAGFPGRRDMALASMGIYVFETDVLVRALEEDAARADAATTSARTSSRRCSPTARRCTSYRFYDENKKAAKYWRDIGTLDAYYEANMDLVRGEPGVQPVRPGVAPPHAPAAGAAGEVRVRRGGPPLRPGARLDHLGRAASSRAAASRAASCAPTCGCTASARSRTAS